MFTGIIEELGVVNRFVRAGNIHVLEIGCAKIAQSAAIGDSVAVNGVCLTVSEKKKLALRFDVMAQTMRNTGLERLKAGDTVNLEGAMKASGAFGGHFVLGHVDCAGTVRQMKKNGEDILVKIGFPAEFGRLVVEKGSVAVDGVSLTAGDVAEDSLTVYLIPHTLKTTNLGSHKAGDTVNLEFDIVGKYIARAGSLQGKGRITGDFLRSKGF